LSVREAPRANRTRTWPGADGQVASAGEGGAGATLVGALGRDLWRGSAADATFGAKLAKRNASANAASG
jgi:hypothetical protein